MEVPILFLWARGFFRTIFGHFLDDSCLFGRCFCFNFKWESAKVSHRRVFALLTPEIPHLEMAQMLQKPVFALPGCQQMSVNTLLCDTLALAEFGHPVQCAPVTII